MNVQLTSAASPAFRDTLATAGKKLKSQRISTLLTGQPVEFDLNSDAGHFVALISSYRIGGAEVSGLVRGTLSAFALYSAIGTVLFTASGFPILGVIFGVAAVLLGAAVLCSPPTP